MRLFSNCINISYLNSDILFVNNHEDQQLSTINNFVCFILQEQVAICLGIIQVRYDKKVTVVERYVIDVSLSQNNIVSKNVIYSSYFLSDRKTVYFT